MSATQRAASLDAMVRQIEALTIAANAQQDQIARLRSELDAHLASHRLSRPVTLWAHLRWMLGK